MYKAKFLDVDLILTYVDLVYWNLAILSIVSNNFWWSLYRFIFKQKQFSSSFWFWMIFVSFSCLTDLGKTSSAILNCNLGSDTLVLSLILERKLWNSLLSMIAVTCHILFWHIISHILFDILFWGMIHLFQISWDQVS